MTVIRHNSISGIVSITAAAGSNLSFYDSAGATLSLDTGNINAGVITATTANFTNATVTGDLTVQGTTTTLDTTVTEVDKLEVGANNTAVGVAITQSGTGDILRLYDGASQVVTVKDGGSVGIGTDNPLSVLEVNGGIGVQNNQVNTSSVVKLFSPSHNTANRGAKIRFGLNDGSFGGVEVENVLGGNASHNSQTVHLVTHNGGIAGDIKALTARYDGNVGIGSDSPDASLVVDSGITPTTIKITSNTESSIDFNDKGGSPKRYKIGTNISSNDGQFEIRDVTANAERLRISSGGQLVVTPADTTSSYATTDGGIDNAIIISSTGTSSSQSAGISFSLNKSGETGAISEIGAIREGSGLSGLVFRTRDNSTGRNERLRITSLGQLENTATSNSSSTTSNAYPALRFRNPQGSYTAGNFVGGITFGKASGNGNGIRAGILGRYDSTGSVAGNVGMYLSFYTSAESAGDGNEKLRITSQGDIRVTQTPGRYTIDATGGATTIANSATVDFGSASGMLVVNNWTNGNVTIYICGGGTVTVVANTGSNVGSFAYNAGIAGYRWTNNYGSAAVFGFFFVRTRTTA